MAFDAAGMKMGKISCFHSQAWTSKRNGFMKGVKKMEIKKKVIRSVLFLFIIAASACMTAGKSQKSMAAVGNKVEITVDSVNAVVKLSEDENFHYKYQRSLYIVKRKTKGSAVIIDIKKRRPAKNKKEKKSLVEIYIPDKEYEDVTGIVKKGGLSLSSVNADITIKNNAGAAALSLPSNFHKKVRYTGKNGSGSIVMDGDSNFMIDVEIEKSAMSTFWGGDSAGEAVYQYQQGSRKNRAKIQLKLRGCAFSVEERE